MCPLSSKAAIRGSIRSGLPLKIFHITGRWREKHENGKAADAIGYLLRKHRFRNIVEFKQAILVEEKRFTKAFTSHMLTLALTRELTPADSILDEKSWTALHLKLSH